MREVDRIEYELFLEAMLIPEAMDVIVTYLFVLVSTGMSKSSRQKLEFVQTCLFDVVGPQFTMQLHGHEYFTTSAKNRKTERGNRRLGVLLKIVLVGNMCVCCLFAILCRSTLVRRCSTDETRMLWFLSHLRRLRSRIPAQAIAGFNSVSSVQSKPLF